MHSPSPLLLQRFGLSRLELSAGVSVALASLEQENRLLRAALDRAEAEAERDPLTGLLNRRGLLRELARTIANGERHNRHAAVLFADVDAFKSLNDRFGHLAGDGALRHVAGLLRAHVRMEDAVARLGGDEFAVVLGSVRASAAQAKAAELARRVEAEPFIHEGVIHTLSLSIGAAQVEPGDAPDAVLARADEAMYAARRRVRRQQAMEAFEAPR